MLCGQGIAAMDTAGAYTDQKTIRTEIGGIYIIQVVYTATGASGSFTSTVLDLPINGYILNAKTIPSPFTETALSTIATAKSWTEYSPTASYDITIKDENSLDVFGGALANRSATAAEQVRPLLSGTHGAIEAYSRVTMSVTGNSVQDAVMAIKLWILKDK